MKTALIACQTIEREIEQIVAEYPRDIDIAPIFYVPSGMHHTRDRLQEAVRGEMRRLDDLHIDRLLLCFGLCGNMADDLETGDYETVMPKTHDCITLLLGSAERRNELDKKQRSYYLTEGWLQGEANLHRQYKEAVDRYGQAVADSIYEQIFQGYESLSLIDTGRGDFDAFTRKGREIAADFHLQLWCLKGDMRWLTAYLLQDIENLKKDDRIILYPPHSRISWRDFVQE
ncbi:MAG: DUF1638 domain-containing protein [Clostridiales bacterium]|nr:DUF1638 domain-containing protein [Clostridiales bacterium]